MTTAPSLRFFNTGQVAVHYAEWTAEAGNDTPAYLFIHGITGRHETWIDVIDGIRSGARAIAVDLRGHGRSGHTPGAYRVPDYARDVAALIDELELGPVIIVGHSLGGMTALHLAATRPDLTTALVLEDPPLFGRDIMENVFPERLERFGDGGRLSGSGLSVTEMANSLRTMYPDLPEDAAQRRAMSHFVTDADAIMHVYDQRIDWSGEIESIMRSVQCPVLLQQGKIDFGGWMRDEDGTRAEELIPNCELAVWDDTGHSLHSEHPERFIGQVNEFVARHKAK